MKSGDNIILVRYALLSAMIGLVVGGFGEGCGSHCTIVTRSAIVQAIAIAMTIGLIRRHIQSEEGRDDES